MEGDLNMKGDVKRKDELGRRTAERLKLKSLGMMTKERREREEAGIHLKIEGKRKKGM